LSAYSRFCFISFLPLSRIYTVSLHDALPILTAIFLIFTILTSATGFVIPPLITEKVLPSQIIGGLSLVLLAIACIALYAMQLKRSEEHTSELQSRENLVCRLLLEKKKS